MSKLYKFVAGVGKVELTDEELQAVHVEEQETPIPNEADKVQTLIEGLSNATSLAEIRSIAKNILESTNTEEYEKIMAEQKHPEMM